MFISKGLMARLAMLGSVVLAVMLLLGGELPTDAAALRIAFGQQQAVNTAQPDVRKLEVGRAIERELRGGESHSYEIEIQSGQYFKVVVEQRGIDVVVIVTAPDGKQIMEVDSPNGTQGPEPVAVITETSGIFRVVVRSLEKDALAGRYEIRVQEVRVATDNDRSLQEATGLSSEVEKLFAAGKYDAAIPLGERALMIREKVLGPDHPSVAESLNDLAVLYKDKGNYAKAESLFQRALSIDEKGHGPDHPDVATSLGNLAGVYHRKGDYAKAEPLLQRALAIREKAQGPDHLDVARSINNLAALYLNKGDYAKVEPLHQRALAIREKTLGADHPDVANSLNNLASLYHEKGDYAKAAPLFQRALAIREKALGPEHPSVGVSLNNLGNFYSKQGDYTKAEPLLQRSLAIFEKVLGPHHPNVAQLLNNLAVLYEERGDYAKAEQLYQRTLAIRERALGPNHRDVSESLNNLGNLSIKRGDYSRAEPLHQRALVINEKALGPDHPNVADSLNNLAALYQMKGEYAKAEPLFQRALAIQEKAFGSGHPAVANSLHNLAGLQKDKGNYPEAEPLFQRALAIREKALGPQNPLVANSLRNLARLYLAKDDVQGAISYESRANQARERDLAINLVSGSERQKLLYLNQSAGAFFSTISLHTQKASDDQTARRMALTAILTRKGRALDAMTDSIAILRRRAAPQEQALLDQLAAARAQLSSATLRGPRREDNAKHRETLKALEETVDQLEDEISVRSAEFRAQSRPVTIEAVQKAIPAGAALVEFASYRPFDPRKEPTNEKRFGQPRYVAYVLPTQGEPRWAEIGDAKSLDQKIEVLRKALRDKRRKDVKRLARAVDAEVMQPVRKLLGTTRHVFISPDGALNLVPFAALVDERGQYLVKRYLFTQLTSGRDLLRLQERIPNKQKALVIADPDFGEVKQLDATRAVREAEQSSQSVFEDLYFSPLKATAEEARELSAILPDAETLTREKATEAALKSVSGPRILHIATHGFFLDELAQVQTGDEKEQTRILRIKRVSTKASGDNDPAKLINPLMRSGLGLAGANTRTGKDENDGILTALEASGLDLWGTKLVVLSACDTGVGEVKAGDGVYGLRRALVLAGSESQMISLWPVSDRGTRELMTGYYRGLMAGQGRSEALRRVQLRMLQDPKRRHPFYWASFIQSGEWKNLDGRR